MNPGDTCLSRSCILRCLNEGRGICDTRSDGARTGSLNEGRGVNPGDTRRMDPSGRLDRPGLGSDPSDRAQRRPGREPRRHTLWRGRGSDRPGGVSAQRRPGREPRRHARNQQPDVRPTGEASSSLNEGRGVNPGDTRKPPRSTVGRALNGPLNEGRGVNPGDTPAVDRLPRPTSACAQRRRRPFRVVADALDIRISLNEGRGVNPGDTINAARLARRSRTAQRRPGREPRRHGSPTEQPADAQRRPGREPRRHC